MSVKGNNRKNASCAALDYVQDRIELEYYDDGAAARDCFGNDAARLYRIEGFQKPRLFALLEERTGVPYDEEFDSWADIANFEALPLGGDEPMAVGEKWCSGESGECSSR